MSKVKWFILFGLLGLALASIWLYLSHPRIGEVARGVQAGPTNILAQTDGITNIVFLGMGGAKHEGGDLTDSIIIFSYNHTSHKLTLLPIPRDIWVASLKAKINTAYHYGQTTQAGEGIPLVKSTLRELTGLNIHYALLLDFGGFETLVDTVGGLDLTIDNTFEDAKYPIPGRETAEPEAARYEHLRFVAGPAHMDGATALKFARSRHALGTEGTDFARSKRQEKIILAFKDKLISTQILLNPATLDHLLQVAQTSFISDIHTAEIGAIIRLFMEYSKGDIALRTIDLTSQFYNPPNLAPYAGQWVLIPTTSPEDITAYVADQLAQD